jgi:hypothetical protein
LNKSKSPPIAIQEIAMIQNDKFEADLRRVEKILQQTKADLIDLLPGMESHQSGPEALNGSEDIPTESAVAVEPFDPKPERKGPFVEHSHGAWFRFLLHKPEKVDEL